MKDLSAGMILVASWLFMLLVGWVFAHDEIARECERQGNFYFGPKTYTCAAAIRAMKGEV